jgi:phenylcoumaran benzylic ether reductase
MPKTLIVGATGHLGQQMLDACKKQGHEVHALVRPATRDDATKMKSLQAIGATIHEGDLKDYSSLVKACKAADNVISVIGSFQIGEEGPLVKAVKEAAVKRFIPSDYGLDPAAAGPGSCVLFDAKSAIHKSIKESAIPYTFVHTNGFFSYWVFTLGDLTKLGGGKLPPTEVNVYGDGNVKGSFVSLPDIAAVTVRALSDPKMQNREVRIIANTMTQNELVEMWQKKSGKSVKTVKVSAADMEKTIATSTAPDPAMMLVLTQLHRSMWIRGDSVKRAGSALDATDLYPDIRLQTVEQGLSQLL